MSDAADFAWFLLAFLGALTFILAVPFNPDVSMDDNEEIDHGASDE